MLAAAPAPASAAVTDGYLAAGGYQYSSATSGTCTVSAVPSEPRSLTFVDNGGPFTQTVRETATIKSNSNAADVSTVSTYGSVRAVSRGISSSGGRLDVTFATSASLRQPAGSVCGARGYGSFDLSFDVAFRSPVWVTLSGSSRGAGNSQADVMLEPKAGNGANGALVLTGRSSGSVMAYVPAGTYTLWSTGSATVSGTSTSASISGRLAVDFRPAGAAGALVGSGKRFVSFGARNCANGAVTTAVSQAAKKKARSIVVKVNGRKVARLAGKRVKARAFTVPAAASSSANVSAVVKLRNGRKVSVSRTYLACR